MIYIQRLNEWWRRPRGILDAGNVGWLINDGNLSFPKNRNNCELTEWGSGDQTIVAIVAKTDIEEGDTLFVDYGDTYRI